MKIMGRSLNIRGKVLIIVLSIAFIISAVSVGISYSIYSEKMDERFKSMSMDFTDSGMVCLENVDLKSLCDAALEVYYQQYQELGFIPSEDNLSDEQIEAYYAAYRNIEANPDYEYTLRVLTTLVDVNEVQSIYLCTYDLDNRKAIFIADGSNPETTGRTPLGYVDDIDEENVEKLINKTNDFEPYVSKSKFGWLSTATQSIFDQNGNIICNIYADINMDMVRADRMQYLARLAVILVLITIILILIAINGVNRAIVIPISKLSTAADNYAEVSDQNSDSVFDKIDIRTGDEIENLKNSFAHMEQEIKTYIKNITAITAERERISAELNVAANIQAGYLPREIPAFPDRPEFELYASMCPAKEVGGDFYDYYLIDDDHLAITVADVSGKGVPAAMFMMESMTLLRNQAKQDGSLSPANIFAVVNNELCERNEAEMFVTVWMAILTISTGHMVCASAGHEYPAIKRAGGEFELFKDKHGFVMAGMENLKYKDYEIELEKGDCIFSYTDGVAEATNASNELFGTDRMIKALNSDPNAGTDELLVNVQNAIDDFVMEAPQFDDITMVALKYMGPS